MTPQFIAGLILGILIFTPIGIFIGYAIESFMTKQEQPQYLGKGN